MATVTGNRITLSPREMPSRWYNVEADLPFRVPPMMSPSGYPITARELEPLFPKQIIEQELNAKTVPSTFLKKLSRRISSGVRLRCFELRL